MHADLGDGVVNAHFVEESLLNSKETAVQTEAKAPSLFAIVANLSCSLYAWKQRLGHFGKAPPCNLFFFKNSLFQGMKTSFYVN